jgi:aquaporin Z
MSPHRLAPAHWPEYLIEAWALGMFMISAAVFTTLFESPDMPWHRALASGEVRRAAIGILMGATAVVLIYSPWGKRSGAHMNPAVTLAFLSMGRVAPMDAAYYIIAQFLGAILGVLVAWILLGSRFAGPPVNFVATLPGAAGVATAFVAEAVISFALMLVVLITSGHARWARYTGMVAGTLVALYIWLEGPLSGMSMNPARTLASALPGRLWQSLWIYLTAPCLGMWLAARVYRGWAPRAEVVSGCAKLCHSSDVACIHCGYQP